MLRVSVVFNLLQTKIGWMLLLVSLAFSSLKAIPRIETRPSAVNILSVSTNFFQNFFSDRLHSVNILFFHIFQCTKLYESLKKVAIKISPNLWFKNQIYYQQILIFDVKITATGQYFDAMSESVSQLVCSKRENLHVPGIRVVYWPGIPSILSNRQF